MNFQIWPKNSPELEQKRQEAWEKDREKARDEEEKKHLAHVEFEREAFKMAADVRRILGLPSERTRFATEEEMRQYRADQEAIKEKEERKKAALKRMQEEHHEAARVRQAQEKERRHVDEFRAKQVSDEKANAAIAEKRLQDARKKEEQAKALEEERAKAAEERRRFLIRCRAYAAKSGGFFETLKRQQRRFRDRSTVEQRRIKSHQQRTRWLAEIAKANEWRKVCQDRYDSLSVSAQHDVDAMDGARRRNVADKRHRIKESDHRDGGDAGPRHCAAGSPGWDNVIRAIEEDR